MRPLRPALLALLLLGAACNREAGTSAGAAPIAPESPRPPAASPAPVGSVAPVGSIAPEPARPFVVIELAPSQGDLAPLLAQHVETARSRGLRPFVEFYADWCGPCRAVDRAMGDPLMIDAFTGVYLMKLNFDDWQTKLEDTGFRPREIPMFYAVDASGRPTKQLSGGTWRRITPEAIAPPLKAFFHG